MQPTQDSHSTNIDRNVQFLQIKNDNGQISIRMKETKIISVKLELFTLLNLEQRARVTTQKSAADKSVTPTYLFLLEIYYWVERFDEFKAI